MTTADVTNDRSIENKLLIQHTRQTSTTSGFVPRTNYVKEQTYWSLVRDNRPFRLFLGSYLLGHMGEWFSYIASITLIEELQGAKLSRTAISLLVITRLMPNVVFSPAGGALADSRDRRESMIALELIGACVALLYLLADYTKSIMAIYIVTFLQQTVAALFEPCRSAMIPLLVTEEEYLKKATTLTGLAWSLMAAFGAGLGGFAVAALGIQYCFILDSLTFVGSAVLMYMVGGIWSAIDRSSVKYESSLHQVMGMTMDGCSYLRGSFFGSLIFLKASVSSIYGACDVLNVAFSERGSTTYASSSKKLGLLFSLVGVGCIIGPLIGDRYTSMHQLSSLQQASICSIIAATVGVLGMGIFHPFFYTCLFTVVRSAGSSATWIYSSILLQTFSSPEKLGRVLSVDYALALLCESFGALISGLLMDNYHFEPEQVSLVMATTGAILSVFWIIYHLSGHGAAREDLNAFSQQPLINESMQMMPSATDRTALIKEKVERKSSLLTPSISANHVC